MTLLKKYNISNSVFNINWIAINASHLISLRKNYFHTSIVLHIEDKKDDLQARIDNLKSIDKFNNNSDSNIAITEDQPNKMREGLDTLKGNISDFKNNLADINKETLIKELEEVSEYLSQQQSKYSTYEESFPNIAKNH